MLSVGWEEVMNLNVILHHNINYYLLYYNNSYVITTDSEIKPCISTHSGYFTIAAGDLFGLLRVQKA